MEQVIAALLRAVDSEKLLWVFYARGSAIAFVVLLILAIEREKAGRLFRQGFSKTKSASQILYDLQCFFLDLLKIRYLFSFWLFSLALFYFPLNASPALATYPPWAIFLGGLLLNDFLAYWTHRFFHLPSVFPIHAIHHSLPSFNLWGTNRVPLFIGVKNTITLYLTAWLIGPHETWRFAAVTFWMINTQDYLQHSGVRWTFGKAGYLFVSPQMHGLHHSLRPQDQGQNFGFIFSFWDRLFGTYNPRYEDRDFEIGLMEKGWSSYRLSPLFDNVTGICEAVVRLALAGRLAFFRGHRFLTSIKPSTDLQKF
jgi:sterol desaturase/sphingolipid hydroxylase (fatty acid hydroxylase superfamily)